MADDRLEVDPERVRNLFQIAARAPAYIASEVAQRMVERLDYMRLEPQLVLDSHSHPAGNWQPLEARFPKARVTACHLAPAQLMRASTDPKGPTARLAAWFAREPWVSRSCAAMEALPIAAGSVDVLWSNLALHWHAEPHRVFPEWQRVLKPGGLVMFSAFGPDTLAEVRSAFAQVDQFPHVVAFTDMHDFGDMLVEAGFVMPVMDMETITLTYSSQAAFWEDVRALGGNPLCQRRRGLMGRSGAQRLALALDETRSADGRLRLSFEVIYGHAWKGEPRTIADGRAIVRRIDRSPHT